MRAGPCAGSLEGVEVGGYPAVRTKIFEFGRLRANMPIANERMISMKFRVTESLTAKVWSHLSNSDVPGCGSLDQAHMEDWVKEINNEIYIHSYIPSVVHGYLGIEKNFGVTRFIPIITKEDMAVYYHICGEIGERVIKDVENIYGGWRSIPTSSGQDSTDIEEEAALFQENYFSSPFSNAAWFQQFQSFNELVRNLVGSGAVGNYVVKTDVANFFDSIDIGRLTRKLRGQAPELNEHINLLEVFLGYWNRRTSGYQQSSRGIPQEIISDGSRNLSHFYLQDFDRKFKLYCEHRRLVYIRWHDDILIFGPSPKSLESAVYNASKLLLSEGLNLNASKTKAFSRREFEQYRGLRALSAIENRDREGFRRELSIALKAHRTNPIKLDTIFRAAIGFSHKVGAEPSSFETRTVFELLKKNPHFIGSLNSTQLFRLITLSGNPKVTFSYLIRQVSSREASAPKATMLSLVRKTSKSLQRIGISRSDQERSIAELRRSSEDSELLNNLCIPYALSSLQTLP